MPFISELFIDVYTSGITDVSLYATSNWNSEGLPIVTINSSGTVPDGMGIKTLLYPSGDVWTGDDLIDLLEDSNTWTLNTYINNSGYYYGPPFVFDGDNLKYEKKHDIQKTHANNYYTLGYVLYFDEDDGEQQVYEPYAGASEDVILTRAYKPQANEVNITANLYSDAVDSSDLWLRIYRSSELPRSELSDPSPYLVIISGVHQQEYYNPSGDIIGSEYNGSNFFDESVASGMYLSLPYISGSMNDAHEYDISLINVDQEGSFSPTLMFNTESIKKSSDDFDEGNLDAFTSLNVKKIGEVPIKKDVVTKKRLMVGIEDIALLNSQFSKKGIYISDYYNVDDPIYTFSIRSGETLPNITGINPYSLIKYYVQFHDQEWIRVSPITRGEEQEGNTVIPKFLVFDKLDIGIISNKISEYIYNFPIYSFRIKIEMDMSFVSGINYSSPSVLFYECHVTDRNYWIGMYNE